VIRVLELDGSLAGRAIRGAVAAAERLNVLVSVAVVDAGGHLKAFYRMDGAEIAGPTLAVDKAYTAVAHRAATGDLGREAGPSGPLQGIFANGGGRYVVFAGGLPVWAEGRVIAGVGVSGAEADQDAQCVAAALAAITDALHAERQGEA
jgi:uncharacterized protein GlcG (DUF336 family)